MPTNIGSTHTISGTISNDQRHLLGDLTARAYDQGLRLYRELLGEAEVAADGRYRIEYGTEQLIDLTRGTANLVVEVVSPDGDTLATSAVLFNAGPRVTIDLTIDAKPSLPEFEQLDAKLSPLLVETRPAELSDDDLVFLQKSTGVSEKQLEQRFLAAKAAAESGLPDWFHYAVLAEGLPGDTGRLLDRPWNEIRDALADAGKTNVIAAQDDRELEDVRRGFDRLQTEHALSNPLPGGKLKVRDLLDAAGVQGDAQGAVGKPLAQTDLRSEKAWPAIQRRSGVDDETIGRVKFTLRSAELTDDHLPTVKALLRDERVHSVRDLAKHFGPDEWQELLATTEGDGAADDTVAEAPNVRQQISSRKIYERVSGAYPDVSVAYALPRHEELADRSGVRLLPQLIEEDKQFDLAAVRIEAYVREHKERLRIENDEQENEVTEDLKRVQRIYRLRAEPTAVARLLEHNLDSSSAILNLGRERFLAEHGSADILGHDVAKGIYARAEQNAAKAFAIYARFSPTIQTTLIPAAIQECPAALQGVPDCPTLFGSLDGCACPPCESVYSPAAYLTDLLAFIETEVKPDPEGEDVSAIPSDGLEAIKRRSFCDRDDQLAHFTRRPDLLRTKLSCRNAETLIPYIDLVAEILEDAVKPRTDDVPQTTLHADQLAEQPEHFNSKAYEELRDRAVFPFSLPFDLWHEESTIHLEKLGTSRAELLETLYPLASGNDPHDLTDSHRWMDRPIAAAWLGLSENQWNLITDDWAADVQAAWGDIPGAAWWESLRQVDALLARAEITYDDLLRLLTLKSFNPQQLLKRRFEDINVCDPKLVWIDELDEHALGFLHRFLRLQRALNWTLIELDQALVHLTHDTFDGRSTLDEAFLVRLAQIKRLRARYDVPLGEILSWWSPLDTTDYNADFLPEHWPKTKSLYETLFLPGRPDEPQYKSFELNATRDNLLDASQPLRDHYDVIAGALKLSHDDLQRLVDDSLSGVNRELNLENLSVLHRRASLSRALGLSIGDFVKLRNLIRIRPFIASGEPDPLQTLRFVDRVETVLGSPWSVAELDYLLRQTPPFPSGDTIAPADGWVEESLQFVQAAFTPLSTFEDPRDTLRQAITLVESSTATSDEELSRLGDEVRAQIQSVLGDVTDAGSVIAESQVRQLLEEARDMVSPGATVAPAVLRPKLQAAEAAFEDAVRQILDNAGRENLASALSSVLAVPAATCRVLLTRLPSPDASTETAAQLLLAAFTPATDDSADPPNDDKLATLMLWLHKAALIVNKLALSHQELSWLLKNGPKRGWLDLSATLEQSLPASERFDPWGRTVQLIQLRDELPQEQRENLFKLFEQDPIAPMQDNRKAYIKKMVSLYGWDESKIEPTGSPSGWQESAVKAFVGTGVNGDDGILQPNWPDYFRDERMPRRVLAAINLLRRLGVTASEAASWTASTQNSNERTEQVVRIKNALKVRQGDGWPAVAKQFRDPLRERQRQALVAYLVQKWGLERIDDLYDHFLIDVEMTPCMMTSRLVQAIASVQLFVQRVLMNLEPGLMTSDEAAEQWEWMKNYRVWEANRKIFLYPENWVQPQLRDDKTPFFKDLENELMQADINNQTAETALLHYLEKLHEVARLQICGQYLEYGNPSVLHVFGRTRELPHRYYCRRGAFTDSAEVPSLDSLFGELFHVVWTPWEQIDCDIEGDHLIPVVYNRRLYLFWPTFTEKDEQSLSQFERQVVTLFRRVYLLLTELFALQGEIATVVPMITQAIAHGTAGIVESGVNTLVIGLQGIRTSLLDVHTRLSDASQSIIEETRDPDSALLDLIQPIPGLGSLFQLIQNLITSLDISGDIAFGAPSADPPAINEVDLTNGTAPDDLNQQMENIGLRIQAISRLVQDVMEQPLLSLVPTKILEVQLAWSEYKNDSWSPKRTSAGLISFHDVITPLFDGAPAIPGSGKPAARRLFTFRTETEHNNLFIRCEIALPGKARCGPTGGRYHELHEIGHFRLSSCNSRVEAVDLPPSADGGELMQLLGSDILLKLQQQIAAGVDLLHGVPQLQKGEPVTPDDDPDRPSHFRCELEWIPLPRHKYRHASLLTGEEMEVDDHYRILARHQDNQLGDQPSSVSKRRGYFYQDNRRTYFCFTRRRPREQAGEPGSPLQNVFFPFYHPYSCELLENIHRFGIPGLYDVRFLAGTGGLEVAGGQGQPLQIVLQKENLFTPTPDANATEWYEPVHQIYNPDDRNRALRPIEEINFSTIGAYSQYNWEIFFHIPYLIACRLMTDQKFGEAQHWFHYIFNPTDASRGSVPEKYWRTRPFVEASATRYEEQQIEQLLQVLASGEQTPGFEEIERAVVEWRRNAFNPYLVARTRTVAFQKAVVMKYIDNLIAWGDSLFRQETREAVNEATQPYLLAAKLLGPRPRRIPKAVKRPELSFDELSNLDRSSNSLVEIESLLPATGSSLNTGDHPFIDASRGQFSASPSLGRLDRATLSPVDGGWRALVKSRSMQHVSMGNGRNKRNEALYFCVPPNRELLNKWDVVADRLFKIRHCQNIEGEALELPLLTPLDSELLERAQSMGIDMDDVLDQLHAPLPHYRFQVLAQKATELCGEVRSLGASLLSALEKRDGEDLVLLRNGHERQLLEAVQTIKEQQVEEAQESLAILRQSQAATTLRRDHYQRLHNEFLNPEEIAYTALGAVSILLQFAQLGAKFGAAGASLLPNIKAGFVTTLGAFTGGLNVGDATGRAADAYGHIASILSASGGLISTMGGYRRRAQDWLLQIELAQKELEGIARQISASEIRVDIARNDLENHKLQIEHNQKTREFMQQKFTSRELYDWMVAQISTVYFQSYQLAYDVARRAERCYRHELNVDNTNYIQFGYWDSLRKGLLAGERLHYNLKRMEVAYLEENQREYEITKHVSLAVHDPMEVLALKHTGACTIRLPEVLFDLDYPGHYMRRVKSISVTVPCVTGPYTNINCKLTLVSNTIRRKDTLTPHGSYARQDDDDRFVDGVGGIQSIVTSSGQNDSGLFEPNLRDERYLPFEGAGAVSEWWIELPADFPSFDRETISDVILHARYTAREGGAALKAQSLAEAAAQLNDLAGVTTANVDGSTGGEGMVQLFSAKHGFATEWNRFLHPSAEATTQELRLPLEKRSFPYRYSGKRLRVQRIIVLLILDNPAIYNVVPGNSEQLEINASISDHAPERLPLEPLPVLNGQPFTWMQVNLPLTEENKEVRFFIEEGHLAASADGFPQLVVERDQKYRLNSDRVRDMIVLMTYQLYADD